MGPEAKYTAEVCLERVPPFRLMYQLRGQVLVLRMIR